MWFKARCVAFAYSKEDCKEIIEILENSFSNYKFERREDWFQDASGEAPIYDEKPIYPITAKNLDGSDLSDQELGSLFGPVDNALMFYQSSKMR